MEDTDKRLRDTSAECLAALATWNSNKKDVKARSALQDSVHELRKVASRLEIDMAISERDEMTQKPIPIPSHRDSQRKTGNNNDDRGNRAPASGNDEGAGNTMQQPPRPRTARRVPVKKPSSGSGE